MWGGRKSVKCELVTLLSLHTIVLVDQSLVEEMQINGRHAVMYYNYDIIYIIYIYMIIYIYI